LKAPNVIVDRQGNDATVLVLSHWPRNRTPAELKADSSTEIAINYLRSPERERYRRNAEAVSNNHYDVDGLMSMWAVLNPEAALEHVELLVATGECGDFDRWSGEHATKIACALYGMELGKSSTCGGRSYPRLPARTGSSTAIRCPGGAAFERRCVGVLAG
jgi:hypothetical protein